MAVFASGRRPRAAWSLLGREERERLRQGAGAQDERPDSDQILALEETRLPAPRPTGANSSDTLLLTLAEVLHEIVDGLTGKFELIGDFFVAQAAID